MRNVLKVKKNMLEVDKVCKSLLKGEKVCQKGASNAKRQESMRKCAKC